MQYVSICIFVFFTILTPSFCRDYTVVTPKAFRIDAVETVVLNLHGYTRGTVLSFSFILPSRPEQIIHLDPPIVLNAQTAANPIVIPVTIPHTTFNDVEIKNRQIVELHVELADSDEDFEAVVEVLLSKKSGFLFMMTELPVYRPSETVSFVAFPLSQEMSPQREVLVQFIIKTPDGIGVMRTEPQFLRQDGNPFQTDYILPVYPQIGNWIVEAIFSEEEYETTESINFKVDRYVLPTFEVTVELEKGFILENDENFVFYVNARYSYGEPVGGNVYVSVKLKTATGGVFSREVFKLPSSEDTVTVINSGRRRFEVPISDIENSLGPGVDIKSLIDSGGSIIIDAAVNGLAEGVVESTKSPEIPFIRSPFRIEQSRLSNFYTPSIIYIMQFDIIDSINGAPREVSLDITVGGQSTATNSDERGQVNFKYVFVGSGDQEVVVRTTEGGIDEEDQASAVFIISPYTSPSNSYIQIEIDPLLRVGQPNVFADFRFNREISEIRYYIMSRGKIVSSGVTPSNPNAIELSQRIIITASMMPSARMVAYYFINGEVVTNSRWFDIINECNSDIKLSVVDDEVEPGQAINFELEGPPGGSVTLIGVDRAAYFLYGGSRLTAEHMFEKMESYDQGCVRSGGENARSVFLQAGLKLKTSTMDAPDVLTLECGQQSTRTKRQAPGEDDKRERLLVECARDGQRGLKTKETCLERGERVLNCTDDVECYFRFLDKCDVATRKQMDDANAGRSVSIRDADIVAIGDQQQRSNFDEGLIFSTRRFNQFGRLPVSVRAKDSITTFDVDAIGMAENNDGFCVATPTEVRVFKEVFVQIFSPFSLKEREQADLRVTVFNHGADVVSNVHVQVRHSPIFCSRFTSRNEFVTMAVLAVQPSGARSLNLVVFPLEEGVGVVEVRAVEVNEGKRVFLQLDSIRKEVAVEPPGVLDSIYGTETIDLDGNNGFTEFSFNFGFPDGAVLSSRQCWIYAYGNLLGPSIATDPISKMPQNIGDIIKQPTGCGEQILVYTGPNVFVHAYREQVGAIEVGTPDYTASLNIIGNGFARMLNYRSNSFPNLLPWANVPYILPSTWLNAYGHKVFTKARLFKNDIDVLPLCNALMWLLGEQQMDGHFDEKKAPIMRQMKGGVGGDITLTAYVVIALLETELEDCAATAGIPAAVARAMDYLMENRDNEVFVGRPYGVALLAYALSLASPNSDFANEINGRLLDSRITTSDGKIFWQGRPAAEVQGTDIEAYWYQRKHSAIDIEVTSYALLASIQTIISRNSGVLQSDLDDTRKMALWLICQRNEEGAFTSTQDTVMGLQALTTYMAWAATVMPAQPSTQIDMALRGSEGTAWGPLRFSVAGDAFKTQIEVPQNVMEEGQVDVEATGVGSGSVSYKCIYRSVIDEESCHFELSQEVELIQLNPVKILLTIRVAKRVGIQAETSIVDIGLLSGFSPVQDSMDRINKEFAKDGMIDRYEISDQNIIFYLTDITDMETTIAFELIQNIRVERPQPAKITVYDFYEPAVHCGIFYALPDNGREVQISGCGDDDEMCKCADGGCPKCRTRDEQENSTTCFRAGTCHSCGEGNDCLNLFKHVCESNYAYVVSVTSIPDPQGNGVFTTFAGNVSSVLFEGDEPENLVKNQIKTFEIREDCYANCQDNRLKPIPNTGNFVLANADLLIIGQRPEKNVKNGQTTFKYTFNDKTIMERVIPDRRCTNVRSLIRANRCNNDNIPKTDEVLADCQKWRKTNTACRVMRDLKTMLNDRACGKK